MIFHCPHCNANKNIGEYSPWLIYQCSSCGNSFRAIHAQPNKTYVVVSGFFRMGELACGFVYPCPFCQKKLNPALYGQPQDCPYCQNELPIWEVKPDDEPDVSGSKWPSIGWCSPKVKNLYKPPTKEEIEARKKTETEIRQKYYNGFEACGACNKCGFIYQMNLDAATCPQCNKKMTITEATESCSNYPYPFPPPNQASLLKMTQKA